MGFRFSAVRAGALALVVFALGAVPTVAAESPQANIIGGTTVTDISTWPYIVAVSASTNISSIQNGQFCDGTLIAPQWVVTAGHCDDAAGGAAPNYVQIGSAVLGSGGEVIAVDAAYRHPSYAETASTVKNDIALLHLSSAPANAASVAATRAATSDDPPSGATVNIAGWGSVVANPSTGSDYPLDLQETTVNVVDTASCQTTYGSANVTASNICAKASGRDACYGDSGGPMTYNGKLVGIVSWGSGCASSLPGVYTRVSSYAAWIESHIDGTSSDSSDLGSSPTDSTGGDGSSTTAVTPALSVSIPGRSTLSSGRRRVVVAVEFARPAGTAAAAACRGAVGVGVRVLGRTTFAYGTVHAASGKCRARVAVRVAKAAKGRTATVSTLFYGNTSVASAKKSSRLKIR